MTIFVQGTLLEKDCEIEWYCDLLFRLADETTILVFDNGDHRAESMLPMSTESIVGVPYHLLLKVRPRHTRYFPAVAPETSLHVVREESLAKDGGVRSLDHVTQGQVLDPCWDTTTQTYLAAYASRFGEGDLILLETAIGKVVVSRAHIEPDLQKQGEQLAQIAVGGYLEWTSSRLDLLALLPHEGAGL